MSISVSFHPNVSGFYSHSLAGVSRPGPDEHASPAMIEENSAGVLGNEKSSSDHFEGVAQGNNRKLDYQFNPESQEVVVKIINKETGEIVRQVPQEKALDLAQKISDINPAVFEEFA